jgi:RNA polymerase sigma-70 factor (ECF subfamily)
MAESPQNPSAQACESVSALEQYAPALQRYLLRRLRRPEDASDLTQEVFERFLRKRHRPEVVRNPLAYLFGIAAHVLSEARQTEQHNRLSYDSSLIEKLPDAASPAEQLDLQRDLLDACATLPKNHLLAIMLVEGQGLSYEQAAQVSGFTRTTIATYLMHARARLKLILKDYRDRKAP